MSKPRGRKTKPKKSSSKHSSNTTDYIFLLYPNFIIRKSGTLLPPFDFFFEEGSQVQKTQDANEIQFSEETYYHGDVSREQLAPYWKRLIRPYRRNRSRGDIDYGLFGDYTRKKKEEEALLQYSLLLPYCQVCTLNFFTFYDNPKSHQLLINIYGHWYLDTELSHELKKEGTNVTWGLQWLAETFDLEYLDYIEYKDSSDKEDPYDFSLLAHNPKEICKLVAREKTLEDKGPMSVEDAKKKKIQKNKDRRDQSARFSLFGSLGEICTGKAMEFFFS